MATNLKELQNRLTELLEKTRLLAIASTIPESYPLESEISKTTEEALVVLGNIFIHPDFPLMLQLLGTDTSTNLGRMMVIITQLRLSDHEFPNMN
jgi:hypothetical protein